VVWYTTCCEIKRASTTRAAFILASERHSYCMPNKDEQRNKSPQSVLRSGAITMMFKICDLATVSPSPATLSLARICTASSSLPCPRRRSMHHTSHVTLHNCNSRIALQILLRSCLPSVSQTFLSILYSCLNLVYTLSFLSRHRGSIHNSTDKLTDLLLSLNSRDQIQIFLLNSR
jgi:hypothetical protein